MALTIPNKQTKKHAYLSLYAHEGVLFVDIIDMYMGVCELGRMYYVCMYACGRVVCCQRMEVRISLGYVVHMLYTI